MKPGESGVHVTPNQRKRLLGITRETHEPPRTRLRASIVLMTAEGMSASQIGRITGSCERAIRDARSRWRRGAFEGLYDGLHTGRPPRVTHRYLRLLSQVVQTDPRKLGYAFAHWTAPRLGEYLKHRTGIGLCDDWVRMRLNRLGFVWRKTKLTIRNLQNSRGKKEGPEAALAAAERGSQAPGEVRTLVWGRG